jgi:hypothetical protein
MLIAALEQGLDHAFDGRQTEERICNQPGEDRGN